MVENGALLPSLRVSALKGVAYSLCLWLPVTQLVIFTKGLWGMVRAESEAGLVFTTLAMAAGLCAAGWGASRLARNGVSIRAPWLRAAVAICLLALSLRTDFTQYFSWWNSRTHNMVAYAAELARSLPADAVVAGSFAPGLLLGSRKRVLCVTDWANADDPVGRFGVTHFVSPENGLDIRLFTRLYPGLVEQAHVFRELDVRGTKVTVYELPPR
jgi:hypothetical protein